MHAAGSGARLARYRFDGASERKLSGCSKFQLNALALFLLAPFLLALFLIVVAIERKLKLQQIPIKCVGPIFHETFLY